MGKDLNKKIVTATKWSAITEIAAKLVTPISTMILARLLTPDAFGIMVTATMIISFAEIFTDAGFQKYLIQNDFKDSNELSRSTNVAFLSNLTFSLVIWMLIILFSSQIAELVGNKGYENVIIISCACIPLEAFSSIQMALFKRKLDFKTLFNVRLIGIMMPLVITVPLAYFTRSYWSLIVGMLALNLCNAIILTLKSSWKPNSYFSGKLFKDMFSFTAWSMFESLSIWLTGYIDIFIVGTFLSTYYVGIYKTSMTTVGQITNLITAATTPILFSALSRLQNNPEEFKSLFFRFQKTVGLMVIPLGVGIFIFSDLITYILLGNQWKEASYFIGWWGLTSSITIVLSHYCSEVCRSLGKPKLSVLAQWLHIIVLVPTVYVGIQYNFETLCLSRSLVRLEMIFVNLCILYYLTKISPLAMFNNIKVSFVGAIFMYLVVLFFPTTKGILYDIVSITICIIIYFSIILAFKSERNIILNFRSIIKK